MKHLLTLTLLLILTSCSSVNTTRDPASMDNSCFSAFSAFNQENSKTAESILKNVQLDDSGRIEKAEQLLGSSLSLSRREALIKAHNIGNNQLGADGITEAGVRLDGTTNYTQGQIRQKYIFLKNAGFSPEEIKTLLDSGIAGKNRFAGLTEKQIKKLKSQEKDFVENGIPVLKKYRPEIPTDKPEIKYATFYQGIVDLLNEPKVVYERVRDLEIEVLRRSNLRPDVDVNDLLDEVLEEIEKKHGFKKSIVLENKSYSADDWWTMLREGSLFNDITFTQAVSNTDRGGHGAYTHRIQWYAVLREIELNPARFQKGNKPLPKAAEMFKHIGDKKMNANIVINGKDMWFVLFDAFSGSLHQPETFHSIHKYWEGILWK
ncbi:MAG: LirA/MavJ family T4SS effector [Bacteriovorax sp.]|jgi:hypothetical protein